MKLITLTEEFVFLQKRLVKNSLLVLCKRCCLGLWGKDLWETLLRKWSLFFIDVYPFQSHLISDRTMPLCLPFYWSSIYNLWYIELEAFNFITLLFNISTNRLVIIQCWLPATVKARAGNSGVIAISNPSFGGSQFKLNQLAFWLWNLRMVKSSNGIRCPAHLEILMLLIDIISFFSAQLNSYPIAFSGDNNHSQSHSWEVVLQPPWNHAHKRESSVFM